MCVRVRALRSVYFTSEFFQRSGGTTTATPATVRVEWRAGPADSRSSSIVNLILFSIQKILQLKKLVIILEENMNMPEQQNVWIMQEWRTTNEEEEEGNACVVFVYNKREKCSVISKFALSFMVFTIIRGHHHRHLMVGISWRETDALTLPPLINRMCREMMIFAPAAAFLLSVLPHAVFV